MKRLLCCLVLTSACATSGGGSGPAITGDDLGKQVAELEHAVGPLHCEDVQTVKAGAISDCPSSDGTFRVTFDDDQGHFHVEYNAR